MVGFDEIDRRFKPKRPIALECRNCGGTDQTVQLRRPRWFNGYKDVVLCAACGLLVNPTSDELIKDREIALSGYD